MAKSGNERQEALRKRRAELGQKRREFFLTDVEKVKINRYINRLRK